MERPSVPHDDITDVMEMADNIERCVCQILEGNDKNLAFSALISATVNCVTGQCKSLNEMVYYRNLFVQIFDGSLQEIKTRNQDLGSSF